MASQNARPATKPKAVIWAAPYDIPSIHAHQGDFITEDGAGSLVVFHGERADNLAAEDRKWLIPIAPTAV